MQLTLVVPELIWPEPDDRESLDALPCPGLNTLIARSRSSHCPPQSLEATLCDVFGLGENAPYAAFRALGEEAALAAGEACWLCADPVHLRLHQERLILADGGSLGIEAAEAQAIVDELNRQFSDLGTFHAAAADRWYLQLPASTELGRFDVLPLSAVAGRSVRQQLPETPEARGLRQMLNAAQMILHQHPANEKTRRRRPVDDQQPVDVGCRQADDPRRGGFRRGLGATTRWRAGLGRAFALPVQGVPANAAALLAPLGSR
jgi:hypothetical protein